MRRREFIALLGGAAATWPVAAPAQQPDRMRLIGVLMAYAENDPVAQSQLAALRAGLAKLGWTEGSNLRLELRWSAGDAGKARTSAKELVDLRPDVILSATTVVTEAVARETRTIPIVFVAVADAIASGFVANLARPGGNITGLMVDNSEQGGKWVQLLKEIAPRTERVALLFNPATAVPLKFFLPSIEAAASAAAIQVSVAPVHTKDEIEDVIAAQARNPGSGLIAMPAPFMVANRELIIASAARHGVPAIYYNRLYAESGGLIAYGSDLTEQFREATAYIDRILKGAKPADLPVEAPTNYELVINLKTAKALGLNVSLQLQQRADGVIE
jgi:putative ABC transport system substrate-binding protein